MSLPRSPRSVLSALPPLLLVLVSASPAPAGEPPADAAAEPTIDSLLATRLESLGGAERWDEVETLKMTGLLNQNGRETRVVLWRRGPERIFWEEDFPGREAAVWWIDGRAVRRDAEGNVREVPPALARFFRDRTEAFLPWAGRLTEAGAVLVGPADTEAGPAWHLRLPAPATAESADGEGGDTEETAQSPRPPDDLYLDRETALAIKADRHLRLGDDEIDVSIYRFEFAPTPEGLVFARYVEVDYGTALISLAVESIEVDPEVPEGLFVPPELSGAEEEGE